MAGKRQRENGSWEFKFQAKGVLERPVYFTFDSEEEGLAYAARVEPMLARGVVPPEMTGRVVGTFGDLIDLYESAAEPSQSDRDVLNVVRKAVSSVSVRLLSYGWVEGWVAALKGLGYAPSTLKKRVEFLARVVDWAIRTEKVAVATNPLRMLPKGYASKGVDKEKLWAGERDRRLEQPEEGAIRKVLVKKEEHLIFDMALETAMRMGGMVTLKWGQIDLRQKTIFLDKTKNGSKRQVPV